MSMSTPPNTQSDPYRVPRFLVVGLLIALVLLLLPDIAQAATGGGGLEWEAPLQKFVASIKGPVAFSISVLALIGCFLALVWGGELNELMRRGVILVMGISGAVFAVSILSSLFGIGATLPALR